MHLSPFIIPTGKYRRKNFFWRRRGGACFHFCVFNKMWKQGCRQFRLPRIAWEQAGGGLGRQHTEHAWYHLTNKGVNESLKDWYPKLQDSNSEPSAWIMAKESCYRPLHHYVVTSSKVPEMTFKKNASKCHYISACAARDKRAYDVNASLCGSKHLQNS